MRGTISRRNSAKAAVRTANPGRIRKQVRSVPMRPDAEVGDGAGDRAPGRRHDPVAAGEQDRRHDDAGRVQDRRERIEHEPPVRDEDLAERDRRREHDLRDAVDPHQLDGQLARGRVEAAARSGRPATARPGRSATLAMAITADRAGQDRPSEVVRRRGRRRSSWRRLLKIGTNGAVRPAATSTSRAISGIRKAAL